MVLDTNTVVSGFLWVSHRRALLDAAFDGLIELVTCEALLTELHRVITPEKFDSRMAQKRLSVPLVLQRYRELTEVV